MRISARSWALLLIVSMPSLGWIVKAQEACQPPPALTATPGSNIFTEQQEIDLGEVLADQLPRYVRFTSDPVVTAHLARVGDRLAKHLPATQLRFSYFLVDLPVPDAFSIAGGRIYVSQKMVSFVRNEDELASIVAHEMGHIVTHQSAIVTTALLKEVLGVTAVSDRHDILKKYDTLEENWRRNPGAFRRVAKQGLERQLVADQVGVYAAAAAGYSPQSFVDIFDRTAQTGGKTGDWLSDFFHTTRPDQVRLRQILNSVENMPQACIAEHLPNTSDQFGSWRAAVYAFSGWSRRAENLHGMLAKVRLDPFTRRDIHTLKFSPDGRYILAQKADTIYVLTHEPFAFLFQIHAPDAWRPQFTPDSKSIAFTTDNERVEVWDIARQKQARVDQPPVEKGCFAILLAPDAKTLACLSREDGISLIDLLSGTEIFPEKGFPRKVTFPKLGFSPDGRYFLAYQPDSAWAIDLRSGGNVPLPSAMKKRLADGFVFLGPDRLLVSPAFMRATGSAAQYLPSAKTIWIDPHQAVPWPSTHEVERRPATLFAFPSGKEIDHLPLVFQSVSAPAHGDYVLLRPIKDYAVGVMDLKTKKIIVAAKQEGFDIWDDVFIHQRADGDVGLYDAKTRRLQAHATLPLTTDSQGFLRALVSPDLKWLAASEGPIWNLTTGKKLYFLRNFQSGWFDGEKAFYADFPKLGDTPRTIARVDLTRQGITVVRKIEEPYASQSGPFLVVSKPQQKTGLAAVVSPCNWRFPDYSPLDCNVVDEVSDVRTGRVLWSRHFPKEHPGLLVEPEEGRVIIRWRASAEGVRDEIKDYPRLEERFAALRESKGAYFVEVLDALTGKVLGAQLVDTRGQGSVYTLGDRDIVSHRGYIEIYSLATGQREGEIFGWPRTFCKAANLITVRSGSGNDLAVYDLTSQQKLDEFSFASDVDFDHFSEDGKRLFVLTTDQTGYLLEVACPTRPSGGRP
jgi:hypothetical protein